MERYSRFFSLLLTVFLVFAHAAFGQKRIFYDDFSDGFLNGSIQWFGDTGDFKTDVQNNNQLLRLAASKSGKAYLSTRSIAAFGSWSFYIRLDFPPSKSNHAEIFLTSNTRELSARPSGYAITAGENGSGDVFRLVRYDSGTPVKTILSGKTNISNGGGFRIKVTRDTAGLWNLYVGKGLDSQLQPDGSGSDRTYTTSKYFGLKLNYTSTRTNKFYFDNFSIIKDPIFLLGASEHDPKSVDVCFSEPFDSHSLELSDFRLNHNIGTPVSFKILNPDTVRIVYPDTVHSGAYSLTVQNIRDLSGQTISSNSSTSVIFSDVAHRGDIVLSEFMYDPPSGLPEYVELYNPSTKLINLQNWQIKDNTPNARIISPNPVYLKPHEYLVLSSDTTALHDWFGTRNYIQMPDFPSLNNSSDAIRLISNNKIYIDTLSYTSGWGGHRVSLERKSYTVPAFYMENWADSPSPMKGTPGKPNLAKPGKTPPHLVSVHLTDGKYIEALFSGILNQKSAQDKNHYTFSPGLTIDSVYCNSNTVLINLGTKLRYKISYKMTIQGLKGLFGNSIKPVAETLIYAPDITPPKILSAFFNARNDSVFVNCNENIRKEPNLELHSSKLEIQHFHVNPDDSTQLILYVDSHLDSHTDAHLHIKNLADENGNTLKDTTVVIARTGKPGDIIINEIMYDPIADHYDNRPDQSEYVELFNRSEITISLNEYHIHDAPDENGLFHSLNPERSQDKEISAGNYAVIYADTTSLFQHSRLATYFNITSDSSHFMHINRTTLSLSSQKGAVFLSNKYGITIDSVYYSNTWQNPNIASTKGISLERIDPYLHRDDSSNWSSSASPKGGTPDKKNSVFYEPTTTASRDGITLDPNPFSPDGDGFNDHLMISYKLSDPNDLIDIKIFDRYGRMIRTLAEGKRAGKSGTIIWDGLSNNKQPNRIGIYIVWFEAYDNASGSKEIFRKTAVLARHLQN